MSSCTQSILCSKSNLESRPSTAPNVAPTSLGHEPAPKSAAISNVIAHVRYTQCTVLGEPDCIVGAGSVAEALSLSPVQRRPVHLANAAGRGSAPFRRTELRCKLRAKAEALVATVADRQVDAKAGIVLQN